MWQTELLYPYLLTIVKDREIDKLLDRIIELNIRGVSPDLMENEFIDLDLLSMVGKKMETGKDLVDALREIDEIQEMVMDSYNKECEDYWESLSEEERLKAFYSVCKRILDGDVVNQRSYRGVLYDTFGFGMESYSIGMECGYHTIHNLIYDGLDKIGKS